MGASDIFPALISSADICIVPAARNEHMREMGVIPGLLLEFLACRRPVIAARVTGIEELVRDGTEVMFYNCGDSNSLARAVNFMLRNNRQRTLLAEKGYKLVRESYPASAYRRRILSVYRDMEEFSGILKSMRPELIPSDITPDVQDDAPRKSLPVPEGVKMHVKPSSGKRLPKPPVKGALKESSSEPLHSEKKGPADRRPPSMRPMRDGPEIPEHGKDSSHRDRE
jgi:hypothetical protein